MGFDGDDGAKTFFPQHPGKFPKGKAPVPHGEMFVGLTVIVVDMHLPEKGRHGSDPVGKRFPGKGVEMARIKTKSAMRRGKGCEEPV